MDPLGSWVDPHFLHDALLISIIYVSLCFLALCHLDLQVLQMFYYLIWIVVLDMDLDVEIPYGDNFASTRNQHELKLLFFQ